MDNFTCNEFAGLLNQMLSEIWLKHRSRTRLLTETNQVKKLEEQKAKEQLILSARKLLAMQLEKIGK